MATLSTIEKIQRHAKLIADGKHDRIRPGQPFRINEAATPGDAVWQGDLCAEVVAAVPKGYVLVGNPTPADRQLVPGVTQGSRHCLDSLGGVTMYRPKNWPDVDEDLMGPCLVLAEDRTIEHPTHGHVTVAGGHAVLCSYQREFDQIARRARRNAD